MQKIEGKAKITTYLENGKQLQTEGKLTEAIEQYQQALQLNPNSVPALAQLASIHKIKKEFYQAIHYLRKLISLEPNKPILFHQLIDSYYQKYAQEGNIDEVITIYQELILVNQQKLVEHVHKRLGSLLIKLSLRQGEIDRISAFFRKLVKNQFNSSWLYYNLGLTLTRQDRLDEAVSCYRKVIQIEPKFWQAYGDLGILLQSKGDSDEAFQCIIKTFKLSQDLQPKYHNYSNLKRCSPEQWKVYKDTLIEIFYKNNKIKPRKLYFFALALYHKGEFLEAIKYCQKSIFNQLKKSKPEFVSQHWDDGKLSEPNFLIIGVGKCGTTSIYDYLCQHPKCLPAVVKEPRYLNSLVPKIKRIEEQGEESSLDQERDFYLAHFPPRSEGSQFITGEASTSTIWSESDRIIKSWFPNIKLIVIVRNPIKRAISHYNHLLRLLKQKYSFEKVMTKELEELEQMTDLAQHIESSKFVSWNKYLAPGLYVYYLKRWMQLFPREQFLILTNEDLAKYPAGVMKQTFDFLGLPEYDGINYTPRNVGSYPKDIDPDLLARLQDFYRPHNQKLEEFLGRKLNWD